MLIRYFEIENEEDYKTGGELIAQTNTYDALVIPNKGDMIFIGDDPYRVYDICYCAEYCDDDDIREVKMTMIDITLIEEKL